MYYKLLSLVACLRSLSSRFWFTFRDKRSKVKPWDSLGGFRNISAIFGLRAYWSMRSRKFSVASGNRVWAPETVCLVKSLARRNSSPSGSSLESRRSACLILGRSSSDCADANSAAKNGTYSAIRTRRIRWEDIDCLVVMNMKRKKIFLLQSFSSS